MNAQATVTNKALLNGKGLPPFESIKPEDVVPTMTELLAELEIGRAHV